MVTPYYDADGITLYHGDCREITEWLTADVLVTDPPYGIAWAAGALHRVRSIRRGAVQSIAHDEDVAARDAALEMWGKSRPAVIFGSWRKPRPEPITHRLIWHKQGRYPGVSPASIFPNDEEVYLVGAGWVGKPAPSVFTTTEARHLQPALIGHPTPKPLQLMEFLLSRCPLGVVADPFAGSGSTLLAARAQGRLAIGVELEERYCDLIASRLAQGDLFGGAA